MLVNNNVLFVDPTSVAQAGVGESISTIGHGQLYDTSGQQIKPSSRFLKEALDYYLYRLKRRWTKTCAIDK